MLGIGSEGNILHGRLAQFRQWLCGRSGHDWRDLGSVETLLRTYGPLGYGYHVMLTELTTSRMCRNCEKTEQRVERRERVFYRAE